MRRRALLALPALLAAPRARAGGLLHVNGTGSILHAARQLGEALAREGGPALRIDGALGSGGAVAALAAGRLDVALAARGTTGAEQAAGLESRPFAHTALAFVAHPSAGAATVTVAEAGALLSGARAGWPNGTPVRVVRRPANDAAVTVMRQAVPALEEALAALMTRPGLMTAPTDTDNTEMLERLRGGFGMAPAGQVLTEGRRLLLLSLDGVAPDLAAGPYPAVVTYHVVLRADASPAALRLRDYLTGAAGPALAALGYQPVENGA